jgi:hypothetical protein
MFLDPIVDRFVQGSPLSAIVRGTLEHALPAHYVDALFERTAEQQDTPELRFAALGDLRSLVVCGAQPYLQPPSRTAPRTCPLR